MFRTFLSSATRILRANHVDKTGRMYNACEKRWNLAVERELASPLVTLPAIARKAYRKLTKAFSSHNTSSKY